jgi:hypothetical protein
MGFGVARGMREVMGAGQSKGDPLGWIQHVKILEGSEDFRFKSPKVKKFAFTNVEGDIDRNITIAKFKGS